MRPLRRALVLAALLAPVVAAHADPTADPATRGTFETRGVEIVARPGGEKVRLDARLPNAPGPRPVVLVVNGWAASVHMFDSTAEHFASRGFAAVLVQTSRWGLDPSDWAKEIRRAIDALELASKDAASPAAGALDLSRISVVGHSYGGAAAIVAAGDDPRIKNVVALAPVNQWHKGHVKDQAAALTVPLLVVAGEKDGLAGPKSFPIPFFEAATVSPAKLYVEVKGGSHNFYQDRRDHDPQRDEAWRFATAWLERFSGIAADTGGWTDGSAAARETAAGRLSGTRGGATPEATPTRGLVRSLGATP